MNHAWAWLNWAWLILYFENDEKIGDFYQNTESLLPVMHPVKFDKEDKIAEALTMKNY